MSTAMLHLDFGILSLNCSGSHMLQGFLDSHNAITCFADLCQNETLPQRLPSKKQAVVFGGIADPMKWARITEIATFQKMIVLSRHPNEILQCRKRKLKSHPKNLELAASTLESITQEIELREAIARQFDALEVSYEELVTKHEASIMPSEPMEKICRFFAVPEQTLRTSYRRFGGNVQARESQEMRIWEAQRRKHGLETRHS